MQIASVIDCLEALRQFVDELIRRRSQFIPLLNEVK